MEKRVGVVVLFFAFFLWEKLWQHFGRRKSLIAEALEKDTVKRGKSKNVENVMAQEAEA